MKFIGKKTKILLTLFVLTLSILSTNANTKTNLNNKNNLRTNSNRIENEEKSSSTLSSSSLTDSIFSLSSESQSNSTSTNQNENEKEENLNLTEDTPKNNWDNGFVFPKFEVKGPLDLDYFNYGSVNVHPKKMEEVEKNPIKDHSLGLNLFDDNQIGFLIEVNNKAQENIKVLRGLSYLHYLGGEKFIIPWRFFEGKPYYQNPFGMKNKIILADILDDKGNNYKIKFSLPWKAIGWYITNEEADKICKICDSLSKRQNLLIKNYKNEINNIYSKIEANYNSKQTIPNLKRLIKENTDLIKTHEIQINEFQAKMNKIENSLSPLMINKKEIINKNGDLNQMVEIYAKKIEDIKKKDPNMQQRAIKEMKNARNKLHDSIGYLGKIAPDRISVINKIKEFAFMFNGKEMENELKNIGPLNF